MGSHGIDVDPAALTEFDRASDEHAESFAKIVQTLEQARVGRESFGVMPGSGEIFDGYEERVRSSLESLRDCAEAVRSLGDRVATCGEVYQQIDTALADKFDQLADELVEGAD